MSAKEILENEKNLKLLVQILLHEKYISEFEVVNGLNQHPEGLNFEDWIIETLEHA